MSRRATAYLGLTLFPILYSEVGGAEPGGAWRALVALAAVLVVLGLLFRAARIIRARAREFPADR
jgi:hypothetical protein